MTMENNRRRIGIIGGHSKLAIAAQFLAANSHCLDWIGSESLEIRPHKIEEFKYELDEGEKQKQEAKITKRYKKRSRSKYSPVEEDRKHSQNTD